MILATGLTPAWQQIMTFRQFHRGEINRAESVLWCASGKVLNVGCALNSLGIAAKTLCLVGGPTGDQIRADFKNLGIRVRWINSQVSTRTCTTVLDESKGTTTELVENSGPIPASELSEFFDAFVEESRLATVVVLSGSLPASAPTDFFRRLLEQTHAQAVLDVRGVELEQTLSLQPFLVKPNREELGRTVGRELKSDEEVAEAMSELRRRGAKWVVVSQGAAPLMAMGPEGLIRITPPKVAVRNPIGCGDCLAAGIAAGIHQGFAMQEALEIGVRAAAENAAELLPARSLTRLI